MEHCVAQSISRHFEQITRSCSKRSSYNNKYLSEHISYTKCTLLWKKIKIVQEVLVWCLYPKIKIFWHIVVHSKSKSLELPKITLFRKFVVPQYVQQNMNNGSSPPFSNLLDPHHVAVISTKHISVIHILREMVSLKNETKYPNNLKKHNCRYRRIIKIIILLKKTFVKKPIIII